MASAKPDPTPAEVMTQLQFSGGRVAPAVDEILSILERVLPGVIDYVNANRKGPGGEFLDLPRPQGYYVAGEKISEEWPIIICTAEVDTETVAPRVFADHLNVMVFVAYDRFETRRQYYDSQDLACLVRGILSWYVRGHCLDSGVQVWQQLTPTGITTIPGRWADYKGHALHLQMFQNPHNDLWTL